MSKTIASPIPYEIKEILLETNAFSLLRATRASDKKTVILKALKTGNTHQQKTALEKEYELLKKLGDNITLKTTGLDWLQEKRAIIFSDPGGTTLNNVIIQNTDNLQTILQFCIQLTRCVAELHRNNLLHGAIQPKNIFYNEKTEKVFLINPQSNELKGISNNALEFFSPEQTERLDFTIDQRSDLYSIGATFYKVFTGEPPFTGNDTNELIHNILAHKPTPPHIKSNKIPAQLSAIILRLLEKNPDHRYQSACSLKNDLEICLEQLSQTGEIKPFILEAEENTPVLDLYTKFYGRTAQIKSILQTMHDARSGSTELFLISGPAGIGKTALVNKIKTDLQNKTALFGSGKFEQYQQAFPYLGWTKALTEISDNISQLDPDTVFSWRNSIINAVGKSGKALTAVIPAIEAIIGEQQEIPEIGGEEAQNRFNHVFQNFICTLTGKEHPLTIFLDDLQWADNTSISLLRNTLENKRASSLLIIGAYRSNEVNEEHPLIKMLHELDERGIKYKKLELQPITHDETNVWLAENLHVNQTEANTLTAFLQSITKGNPLFIRQQLRSLEKDHLIAFDRQKKRWFWDINQINSQHITPDIANLLTKQLNQLPPDTIHLLQVAACIGQQFDIELLATLTDTPVDQTNTKLRLAELENLIFKAANKYSFTHDKIHQAIYTNIPDNEQKTTHWKIGKALLLQTQNTELEIFKIATNLNQGYQTKLSLHDKKELATLNQRAGRQAKSQISYKQAAQFYEKAIYYLENEQAFHWAHNYELIKSIFQEGTEIQYLCGNYATMQEWISKCHEHFTTLDDKFPIYETQIKALFIQHKPMDGIKLGLDILAQLGIHIPENPTPQENEQQIGIVLKLIETEVNWDAILKQPLMTSPIDLYCMRIISYIVGASFSLNMPMVLNAAYRLPYLTLTKGASPLSPFGLAGFSSVLNMIYQAINPQLHFLDTSYRLIKMAIKLLERFPNNPYKGGVYNIFGAHIIPSNEPLQNSIPVFVEATNAALQSGDYTYGSYAAQNIYLYSFLMGEPLDKVSEHINTNKPIIEQTRQIHALNWTKTLEFCLLRFTDENTRFNTVSKEENNLFQETLNNNETFGPGLFYLFKTITHYMFGDFKTAHEYATKTATTVTIQSSFLVPLSWHYLSLTSLRTNQWNEGLTGNEAKLEQLAERVPQNYLHKLELLKAEHARAKGETQSAITHYQNSIRSARANGFIHDEAIASELAGKFSFEQNMTEIGELFIKSAAECYKKWNAPTKVKHLHEQFPDLIPPPKQQQQKTTLEEIDLNTVLKATSTISKEIVLSRLLEEMLKIIFENAGAERGILLLENETSGWSVETKTGPNADYSKTIIDRVIKTNQTVATGDATNTWYSATDTYISQNKVKSILAIPLIHQARLKGVIYLENNLINNAFPKQRVKFLETLATQAAVSLENAIQYRNLTSLNISLKREIEERRQAEAALAKAKKAAEEMAQIKSEFLDIAAHELRTPVTSMKALVELNCEQIKKTTGAIPSTFERINRQIDKLSSLIIDLLDVSKLEKGIFSIQPQEFSLTKLIKDTISEFRLLSPKHYFKYQLPTTDIVLLADPRALKQVLTNIVDNAIKHTDPGKLITIQAEQTDSHTTVSITDEGHGIPQELQKQLFTRFFREKIEKYSGLGLGLYICRKIIELHNGKIWATSELGKGSVFTFELPNKGEHND